MSDPCRGRLGRDRLGEVHASGYLSEIAKPGVWGNVSVSAIGGDDVKTLQPCFFERLVVVKRE